MDFPISVPSIGLVGGKFADEDPLGGTPGSLIPSAWGNAVTEEILHVITVAGLVPDEADNTQLAAAISQIIGTARPIASQEEAETATDNTKVMTPLRTVQSFIKRLATQTQVNTGTDDASAVSPLKLAQRLASNSPVVGAMRNARMSVSATSTTATFAADEVVLKLGLGGKSWSLFGFNKTINLSGTGAGGMDFGTATANGFLGIYACFNPDIPLSTTNPMLLGQIEAGVVFSGVYSGAYMPAGYTASALVSVAPISGTAGQFAQFFQSGNSVDYLGGNLVSGSSSIGSAIARGGAVIPYSAKFVSGFNQAGSTAASAISQRLYPTATGAIGGQVNTANVGAGTSQAIPFRVAISTPQTVYQTTVNGAGTPAFTISVSNYEF